MLAQTDSMKAGLFLYHHLRQSAVLNKPCSNLWLLQEIHGNTAKEIHADLSEAFFETDPA